MKMQNKVDLKKKQQRFSRCLVVQRCYCAFMTKLSYEGVRHKEKNIKEKVRSVRLGNFMELWYHLYYFLSF